MESTAHGHEVVYSESGAAHIASPRVYLITWVILLILMAMTVGATFIDFGPANNLIAMAIAVTKAALVVMFFMQVKGSSKLTIIWATIGFAWLPFMFCTLVDYLARGWMPVKGWQ